MHLKNGDTSDIFQEYQRYIDDVTSGWDISIYRYSFLAWISVFIFIDITFGPRNFYLYLSILCQNSTFPNSGLISIPRPLMRESVRLLVFMPTVAQHVYEADQISMQSTKTQLAVNGKMLPNNPMMSLISCSSERLEVKGIWFNP